MRHTLKKKLSSIPSLIEYFRLITIPVFARLYLRAPADANCYRAIVVMGISFITDVSDGMIVRKSSIIIEFGKPLDPLVDKLAHGAILLRLWSRYLSILLLLVLFVLKEGFILVMGAVKLKGGKKLNSAKWFDKCCTTLLLVVLSLLLLFPHTSLVTVSLLALLYATAMFIIPLFHIPVLRSM